MLPDLPASQRRKFFQRRHYNGEVANGMLYCSLPALPASQKRKFFLESASIGRESSTFTIEAGRAGST